MSSITTSCIQLIILISRILSIHQTIAVNQCDFSSAPYLQSAAFSHSIILRVQPIDLFEQDYKRSDSIIRKVLVREVIKSPLNSSSIEQQVKTNDMIIIRINDNDDEYLDNSCWHLLRVGTVDVILFLNGTTNNEFDLHYPPVESTLRVRENIDAVLNHRKKLTIDKDPYSPQVLIKTRLDRPILSKDYSLQCNSRGNPLPRLLWSKKTDINETLEYYPLSKQCHRSCRIYSIQYKYQSTLFFQSLTLDDIGTYVCHAENPMSRTSTSVYLDIDRETPPLNQLNKNLTCSSLQDCHNRGQCISINNQLKCLCDSQYFGERCETNYDDVIKKQDSAILLFKSRFLAGFILVLIGFCLLLILLVSWLLARNNKQQRNKFKKNHPEKTSADKPLLPSSSSTATPAKQHETIIVSNETNGIIPVSSLPAEQTKKLSSSPRATIRLSQSPTIASKIIVSPSPPIPIRRTVPQGILTRESSIATDEDDEDGFNSFLRQYQTLPPVPTKIDEEYEERFSMSMNTSEELGLGSLMNGYHTTNRVLSPDHDEFYRTGIIKPLDMGNEPSQRYTKYVSSYSKFVLPRPVKSSSLSEYQQR